MLVSWYYIPEIRYWFSVLSPWLVSILWQILPMCKLIFMQIVSVVVKKVSTSLFQPMVEFWTSFWLTMLGVYIPYSGVCFLEHSGGLASRPQWQWVSKRRRLRHDSSSVDLGSISSGRSRALLWVTLEPILHTLYETQVGLGIFHEQNHGWCATSLSHPSISQNRGTDSFKVFFCSGCGWASWTFSLSDMCATVFEHHYSFHCGRALFQYCAKRWISAPDSTSVHKT
jgi:hypothetical protein